MASKEPAEKLFDQISVLLDKGRARVQSARDKAFALAEELNEAETKLDELELLLKQLKKLPVV